MGDSGEDAALIEGPRTTEVAEAPDLPPVVARLVVELRSDGTRTVARGAVEDRQHGESAALTVSAASPAELVLELTKVLFSLPRAAGGSQRALEGPKRPGVARRVLRRLRG